MIITSLSEVSYISRSEYECHTVYITLYIITVLYDINIQSTLRNSIPSSHTRPYPKNPSLPSLFLITEPQG